MTTAADILVEALEEWGIDTVFGMPGDGINGIMEALRIRQESIRFIQVRHEESAAFMACAHAKYTGKIGCCLATSGPGGIHLLNGLYDAKLDGQPVLALTGLQFHDMISTHTQQDVELDKLFMDVSVYNARIMGPAHVEPVMHLACRTALARRGVAHVTFPVDMQSMPMKEKKPSKRNMPGHAAAIFSKRAALPRDEDLEKAAQVLNQGKRIVIMAGRGALGASQELEQLAEKLQAPIVKPILGKGAVPDNSRYTTGALGLLGTRPSQEAIEDCDTLLMIGTSFPYIEFMPEPGQARAVQIDLDPMRIGLRYPVEIGLVGDSRKTIQHLLPMLKRNRHRGFLRQAQRGMVKWRELMKTRGTRMDMPMKAEVVARELNSLLDDNAIVSTDSGSITTWWARQLEARPGQMYSCSGTLATMACGLPYAIAAQIAYPDRQCVGFVGDGGFSMLMADFVTAVKYKLPIKIIVIKNNSLAQIKWEQMVFLGNPEYACDLFPMDFAMFARACGALGFTIDDPKECGATLQRALSAPGPVLVECEVDPHEAPMPPKVTPQQAKKFAQSLARGTPHRGRIALTQMENAVRELV